MAVDSREHEKEVVARAAASLIEDGMVVGLGSGSTAERFVRALGDRAWASGSVLWRGTSADAAMDVALIGLAGDVPPLPPGRRSCSSC